jgi:hypothetical protein
MLTLDNSLRFPAHVMFSVVGEDAFLLNTQTNKYFLLEEVGARLWQLLKDGNSLREGYQTLMGEYEIDPAQLERDLLELLEQLQENGLVGIIQE